MAYNMKTKTVNAVSITLALPGGREIILTEDEARDLRQNIDAALVQAEEQKVDTFLNPQAARQYLAKVAGRESAAKQLRRAAVSRIRFGRLCPPQSDAGVKYDIEGIFANSGLKPI